MEKTKILIIEDDEDIREGVQLLLEGEGYEALGAASGQRGLALLDDTIDLVILDVMMPGLSGLETCAMLRQRSNVPVLLVTARSSEADKL